MDAWDQGREICILKSFSFFFFSHSIEADYSEYWTNFTQNKRVTPKQIIKKNSQPSRPQLINSSFRKTTRQCRLQASSETGGLASLGTARGLLCMRASLLLPQALRWSCQLLPGRRGRSPHFSEGKTGLDGVSGSLLLTQQAIHTADFPSLHSCSFRLRF